MVASMDGLLEKRRELMARRRQLKGELTRLGADVAAIDRVFRMMDPVYRPETPDKTSPNRHSSARNPFPPGKMTVAMLEAMRMLDRPSPRTNAQRPCWPTADTTSMGDHGHGRQPRVGPARKQGWRWPDRAGRAR